MIKDNQDQDTLKEIASVEIIAKIEKGETIDLDHVRILGDLNISKLNLASKTIERTDLEINSLGLENNILIINSIIKVRNSEILGISNFSELAFSEEFDFSGSEFKGIADFRGAKFYGPTDFSETSFSKEALFDGSEFSGGAQFEGCQFIGWAEFIGSRIMGIAQFRRCMFSGKADFLKSQFSEYKVDFSESEFKGDTFFTRCIFSEDAYFIRCVFNGNIDFGRSQFDGDLLTFKDSKFLDPKSQEDACRRAKNVSEKNGDKEAAGYHFYREMDARRKQKPFYLRYPEFVFVQ